MRRLHLTLSAVLAAVALQPLAALAQRTGQPQVPQQQQQQHAQMMAQMQRTVQRMTHLQERAHHLAQVARESMQNRVSVTEQERLMARATESFEQNARHLKALAERTQDMIRSRDFQRDREMQRDMARLHDHLDAMAARLDESLQVMERVRQRSHTRDPQ
jgi:glucose/arabinose dehydrogenase